jgi:hypothetical protein
MKLGSVKEANAARRDLEKIVRAWCDWRDALASAPAPKRAAKKQKPRP